MLLYRYEEQRDMLYNQTFNLDQVAFAAEGIKDAQQTVCPEEYWILFLSIFIYIYICNYAVEEPLWLAHVVNDPDPKIIDHICI